MFLIFRIKLEISTYGGKMYSIWYTFRIQDVSLPELMIMFGYYTAMANSL